MAVEQFVTQQLAGVGDHLVATEAGEQGADRTAFALLIEGDMTAAVAMFLRVAQDRQCPVDARLVVFRAVVVGEDVIVADALGLAGLQDEGGLLLAQREAEAVQPIARLAEEMGEIGGDGGGVESAAVLRPQGEVAVHPAADGFFQHGAIGLHPARVTAAGGRGVVAPVVVAPAFELAVGADGQGVRGGQLADFAVAGVRVALRQAGQVARHPVLIWRKVQVGQSAQGGDAGGEGQAPGLEAVIEWLDAQWIAGEQERPGLRVEQGQGEIAKEPLGHGLAPVAPGRQDQCAVRRLRPVWRGLLAQASEQVVAVVQPAPEGQHHAGVRAAQRQLRIAIGGAVEHPLLIQPGVTGGEKPIAVRVAVGGQSRATGRRIRPPGGGLELEMSAKHWYIIPNRTKKFTAHGANCVVALLGSPSCTRPCQRRRGRRRVPLGDPREMTRFGNRLQHRAPHNSPHEPKDRRMR